MSLAENLLNTLPDGTNVSAKAGEGAEERHIIVGADRKITVPNELKNIAVTGDKNVETVTFDCVRYWDDNDLSTFAIYLNYTLPNGTRGTYSPVGIERFADHYSFDWTIDNSITANAGSIEISVVAIKPGADVNEPKEKQWGSFPNSDLKIIRGLDLADPPETNEENGDLYWNLLSAILNELNSKIDISDIVQTAGNDTTKVMSQKASTKTFANKLKGKKSGATVALDDVSPLPHQVRVELRSKNQFYLNADKNTANHGITVTGSKGASAFVLNGTATADQSTPVTSGIPLKAGTYTVSITGLNANSGNDRIYVDCNGTIVANYIYDGSTKTFTINEDASTVVRFVYANGTVYDNKTVTVQIEEGTTATAFTPNVDAQAVTVKSCGKNIIDLDMGLNSCFTKDGDVYTLTKNGGNRFSGRIPCFIPANQKFCFSADFVEYTGNYHFWIQAQIVNINGSYDPNGLNFATGSTVYSGSRSGGIAYVSLYLESSDPDGTVIRFKNLQIEIGDTATAYEPYKEGQTTITSTEDEANFQSIAPNMTLTTDTDGAVIEANYEKDSNIVIDKLTKAVIALGGNV